MQQSFIDQPSSEASTRSLTSEQVRLLNAELEALLDDERERADRNQDRFDVLAADTSVDASERDAARRAAEDAATSIQEIEQALADLDAGLYGICSRCDRPIPFERLQALPKTRTCVECWDT